MVTLGGCFRDTELYFEDSLFLICLYEYQATQAFNCLLYDS